MSRFVSILDDLMEPNAKLAALDKSLATIEFDLDGTIVAANTNFLKLMGYELSEIVGRHHSIFVDEPTASSQEYTEFWAALRKGTFQSAEYRRLGKSGRDVWIQATYTLIRRRGWRPARILKCAMDVTELKRISALNAGQVAAIHKSLCVVHFDMQGHVLDANSAFLESMGYDLQEVLGKHHSIFMKGAEADSWTYSTFWQKLREGEHQTAQFRRYSKSGKPVWLQASYNPILDLNGKPFMVVKYASDITDAKLKDLQFSGEIAAINRAQCVAHFDMQGRVIEANENFLRAFGYDASDVVGRHHRMFVDPDYATTREYTDFWHTLRNGEFHSATYKRYGQGGREVHIQATYNPIKDFDGNTVRVVKYATDITENVRRRRLVTNAANTTAAKVKLVAAAAAEMNTTFSCISSKMSDSRQAVDDMYDLAKAADTQTDDLRTAAKSMDDVVKSISRIANQINLLALNATIEASRAGESGKGFATVAFEVKTLAHRAAQATEDISEQIGGMQTVADKIVGAIDGISGQIETVKGHVTRVAASMESQIVATREISENIGSAAIAVDGISTALCV